MFLVEYWKSCTWKFILNCAQLKRSYSNSGDFGRTIFRVRKRKITWYNPPWDSNVKTNLGRKFLLVVDKCFPKNHPLNKIFNRHTLKLSYSCMPNMKAVTSSHNKNMLAQDHGATAAPLQQPRTCDCKNRPKCPLQGNCVKENVVYQETVTTETTTKKLCRTRLKFQRTV